jgi:tetratricopeptide (TPR) repeat protein
MSKEQGFNPQLYHYLKKYQDDPTSRVFAPLAEAYRKAGLLKEAVEIAREGLKIHPTFIGGKVALARALFDLKEYQSVIETLKPVVADAPDNLIAQRILGDSYLILGRLADAVQSYKMLLYFSPDDPELSQMVQELENQAYHKGDMVIRTDFEVKPTGEAMESDPEVKKFRKIRSVEKLLDFLLKIERYRMRQALSR